MFYGSIIFRFFGVLLRWFVINCRIIISRNKRGIGFIEVWKGKSNNDSTSKAANEISDILLGAFFIVIVCYLLMFVKV